MTCHISHVVLTSHSGVFLPSSPPIGMRCCRCSSERFPLRGRVSRHECTGLSPPNFGQAVLAQRCKVELTVFMIAVVCAVILLLLQ